MFLLERMMVGQTPPIVYKDATTGESYVIGEALTLSSGKVTKCSGTTKPALVAVGPADENGCVPCIEVNEYMVFETELSAAGTSLNVGDKVTLATDGLRVTATTTSGVAEIVGMDGTAVGSIVHVKF